MIHPKHCLFPIIGVVLLTLLPKGGFAQTFELQKSSIDYVARKGDTITIKWPRGEQKDSLTISVEKGGGKAYCKLTDRFIAISQDTTFSINGHQSCKIRLEEKLTNPTTLRFTIQKKDLGGTFTFIQSPIVSPNTLDFGTITFNRWDNSITLDSNKGEISLSIINPSSEPLILIPPGWITVSPQSVPPHSKGFAAFKVDILKVIDTLNHNSVLLSNSLYDIRNTNINLNKNHDLILKSIHIGLQRDFPFRSIVGLLLVICLIGGAFSFLFLKKRKKKSYHRIKQYMEKEFNATLDATEAGILKGLAEILHTTANARVDKEIHELLSAYQAEINNQSAGEISEIHPLPVIGMRENTRKASEIINAIIRIFNEKIKIHQQQWHLLATHLGQYTKGAFSSEGIEKLVEQVKSLKEEQDNQSEQIKDIARYPSSSLEDAIKNIKSNLDSLESLISQLKSDFPISGDSPEALKQNLSVWKEKNDDDWKKLFETFKIKGNNAVLISHLEGVKQHIDEICGVCEQKDITSVKDYINAEKDKNTQMLNIFAQTLDIQIVSRESINEGIKHQFKLIEDIIDALSAKASTNAPGAGFRITKDNVIDRINSLRDPNFGKPIGFPDFVANFTKDLKKVEEELKSVIDIMRKTNDNLFTNLLERAYYQEGRQMGVKPALDILYSDSKLKEQLGISLNEMQYVQEFNFYDKFVKKYLDIYVNDLAKIYAYGKVGQAGIDMAEILKSQHNIEYSSIDNIWQHLFMAYQKIDITLLVPKLFEDRFDPAIHENSLSASSFLGMYNGKYGNFFDSIKSSVIYDIDEIGMKSETLGLHKKPKVFRK